MASVDGQAAAKAAVAGFTTEERAAMRERLRDAEGEAALLAKVAEMRGADRAMCVRLHEIITASAPELVPRTWYGMPAWARDGKVVCFFQSAQKFKARYATLGFNDAAHLDDGTMWPTAYALTHLSPAEEAKIVALVRRAVGTR